VQSYTDTKPSSVRAELTQDAEIFLTAHGYNNVTTEQLDDWRREHMSDLMNAFDFENVRANVLHSVNQNLALTTT
jgi:hypothetical protein